MADYRVRMIKGKIRFQDRLYTLRLIDFGSDCGKYWVGSIQLELQLIDVEDNCRYTSDEARCVDEAIFFYVAAHEFKLSDEKLRQVILEHIE